MSDWSIPAGIRKVFHLAVRTRARARADADAELTTFLEERIDDLVRRGLTPEAARAEALKRLGGPLDEVQAELRRSAERREGTLSFQDRVDDVRQDLRFAVRSLVRQPGLMIAAVLSLGVGIGANATMVGVVDALLLRPPPGVHDPGTLVWITATGKDPFLGMIGYHGVMYPDYLDVSRSSSVVGAAAFNASEASFGRGTEVRQINTLAVTHTFMSLLGAQPALGRFFTSGNDSARAAPEVVLGYAFWQQQFAGATDVVGRVVRIDTKLFTVVGVAPRGFNGIARSRVDVYVPPVVAGDPDAAQELADRDGGYFTVVARLRLHVRPERLASELNTIYHNATPGDKLREANTILVAPLRSIGVLAGAQQDEDGTIALWLAGVAFVVLLITCANIGSLLLTRAVLRNRETAVRLALGISRARLVGMLMTDGFVLAVLAGIASLLVGQWGGGIVRNALLSDIDLSGSVLEPRVLAVTVLVTLATGIACGLVPALYASRPDLTVALKGGEREGTLTGSRLLSGLLVGQVALTLLLLVGTGLFMASLRNLDRLDLGFDVSPVLRARADLEALGYTPEQTDRFVHELRDRVAMLPGVRRAAIASGGPFGNGEFRLVAVPGHAMDVDHPPEISAVTPDFLETLGMSLVSGRAFSSADRAGTDRVAIVNTTMARHYWPGDDALGKCIQIGAPSDRQRPDTMPCTTVVGVVRTARHGNFSQTIQDERPVATYYVPYDQEDTTTRIGSFGVMLYVRTAGDAERLVPAVRRTMEAMVPDLPYPDVAAFSSLLAPQIRPWRLGVEMFSLFGGIALVLSIIGLYGVLAFRTSQRTHEIGVRVALGAQRADVHGLVIREGLLLGGLGVGIGVVVALIAAPMLGSLVYGLSPRDPGVLGSIAVLLLAIVVFASYLPARRAARIDPIEALQEL